MSIEKMVGKKVNLFSFVPSHNGVFNCDDKGNLKYYIDKEGKKHQRISSQCQNRAVRECMAEQGFNIGLRCDGKELFEMLHEEWNKMNVSDEQRKAVVAEAEKYYDKSDKVGYFLNADEPNKIAHELLDNINNSGRKSFDLIMHGRMNAKKPTERIDGAMSVADAIAINELNSIYDYRTLASDNKNRQSSINIGVVEQASSLFYKNYCIDCNTLIKNTDGNEEYIKEILNWDVLNYYSYVLGNGKSHSKYSLCEPSYIALVISNTGFGIDFDEICNKNKQEAIHIFHEWLVSRNSNSHFNDVKFVDWDGVNYKGDIQNFLQKELFD